MIWDGEGNGIEGGKSWADCDAKPSCRAQVDSVAGIGRDGSTGLAYHAEGPQWSGFGWNWFGWYPEDAGTDVRGYDQISFWIKVEAESVDAAPDPGSLTFNLGCSKGQKTSAGALVSKYAENALDGEWHRVTIPLADFYVGKEGAEFDPASAWEFRLSTWNASPRNFTVILDDVVFEKS